MIAYFSFIALFSLMTSTHGMAIHSIAQRTSHQLPARTPEPLGTPRPVITPGPKPLCKMTTGGPQTLCNCHGTDLVTLTTGTDPCGYTSLLDPGVIIASTDTSNGVIWACTNYDPALTTCVTGLAVPVSTDSALAAQASQAVFDVPYCESGTINDAENNGFSDGFLDVGFMVALPNWQSTFDKGAADSALQSALSSNSGCTTYSAYSSTTIGQFNTTLVAVFGASSLECTNWQVTQVILATTGGKQDTACNSVPDGVDAENTVEELWVDGHPANQPFPQRRGLPILR